MNKKAILRTALFLVGFIMIAWFVRNQVNTSPQEIRTYILSFGILGPLLFMGLYTIGPIVTFPTSVLSLAAAFAYGVWPGMLYIVIGATGASLVGYVMGRFFGDSIIRLQHIKWADALYTRMSENGFLYVLILRLIPLIGFDLLSYAAGMTRVKIRSFVPATVIGMLPGTFVYSLVGSSLASGDRTLLILAFSITFSLLLITFLLRKRVRAWLTR
ncbi:TVP38/TMEM64 family protein [Halobacillus andaensis]|uniref:TVP38/TMEM64 family membrane protein n=1 Tax=Halobacillus andaensis TaxID=1176239 RepID=A0A917EYW6_HALAA|nr:TVP38/TMEM64 family protein [Halobacillus andaensis]MBP2006227.1 putative membrane protein YdjX (TVP38/TMEM64 family) [Halobacillus andaensis]GGF33420.1 TVP38/TMEM64 family protein [Halobacillus andaensis]